MPGHQVDSQVYQRLHFIPVPAEKIILHGIRICPISLRSGYFYIAPAPGANGNSPEYAGLLIIALQGEWKIIIYLNAGARVHSEVN